MVSVVDVIEGSEHTVVEHVHVKSEGIAMNLPSQRFPSVLAMGAMMHAKVK